MSGTVKGIYMDDAIWNEMKKESEKEDRSISWMISDILKTWIENKKKARAKRKK